MVSAYPLKKSRKWPIHWVMRMTDFRRAGHTPSLVAALLHFDVSFMIWVILGALGAYIAEDLGLSASQKGVLVAVPLLSAAVARVTFGILADRFGPRRVGTHLDADRDRPAAVGLARRDDAVAAARRRHPARRRGRLVRDLAAAGEPLVPGRVPGPGDGHRGRGQLGHGRVRAAGAADRRAGRLARDDGPGRDPRGPRADRVPVPGQGAAAR